MPREHDAAVLLAQAGKQPPAADLVAWARREHTERCVTFVLRTQLRGLYGLMAGVRRAQASGAGSPEQHLARLNAAATAIDWLPIPGDILVQIRDIQSRTALLPLVTKVCRGSRYGLLAEVLDHATQQDPFSWVLENKVDEACTEALRLAMVLILRALPQDPGPNLRQMKLRTPRTADDMRVTLDTLTFGAAGLRVTASMEMRTADRSAFKGMCDLWGEGFVKLVDNFDNGYLPASRHLRGTSSRYKHKLQIEQIFWPPVFSEARALSLSGPPAPHGPVVFEVPLS
ncbi:hypothetical protein ACLQ2R_30980 [Streptosporangium sp. DT93]|uniref:hypothetical protein n=1 Tax=Streptosporangium sp. DT93 TaxID=3393428 RepID=UPI003CEFA23E